jgi:predicted solute-binding protein
MPAVRVVVDRNVIRSIERSREVERICRDKAERIRGACNHPGYAVESTIGRNRARAEVFTKTFAAMYVEATEHRLLRALDAGRG